ncbi:MAG TPA: hypothetical protein VND21_05695 [Planctomycetota bacterium]|nr:hypothetical protein [Planctomycetota bacterium]
MRRDATPTGTGIGTGTGSRWAVATLDHLAALSGWSAVPEGAPAGGGWRRLYLADGDAPTLAAVGPDSGEWVSLGIETPVPRGHVHARAADLLRALAPYEVAVDLDAGADRHGTDAVLRLALRLFTEGLHPHVFRNAVANLVEAAAEARRILV